MDASPPFLFTNVVGKWLNTALDVGIPEQEFWGMTFGEVERAIESYSRVKKNNDREKASLDYILADLIGRSISRVYNSSNTMPPIDEAYPTIFTKEEVEKAVEQKKADLSALRFKLFANAYNSKFKEVAKADE